MAAPLTGACYPPAGPSLRELTVKHGIGRAVSVHLSRWTSHADTCERVTSAQACSCGLQEALLEVKALTGKPEPTSVGGWHRFRGSKRHLTLDLACCWVHDNGAEIYQGRPDRDNPKRFVYLLQRPDGTAVEFALQRDAKSQDPTRAVSA